MPHGGRKREGFRKRFLFITKEEDITQRLNNLDNLRSRLTWWYTHLNFLLNSCRGSLSVTEAVDRLQSTPAKKAKKAKKAKNARKAREAANTIT